MRVSVITPCYNSGPLLDSTVASLLAQTVRPFEALFLDDGSTDDTWQRLESYRSRHGDWMRIFRRPRNLGYGMRAELISHAGGDWIAYLDHDDLWEPTKLERQIQAHRRHPGAVVSHTDGWVQPGEDATRRSRLECPDYQGPADPFEALYFRNFILASSAMYARSWIDRIAELGKPQAGLVGDHDAWLNLSQAGAPFIRVAEPLTAWRVQPTGQLNSHRVEHYRKLELMHAKYERENRSLPRFSAEDARRRLFKIRLDVIRILLYRGNAQAYEEAAARWAALLDDWDLLDAHRPAIVRLMALARSPSPKSEPSEDAPRGRWNPPNPTASELHELESRWLSARQHFDVRANLAEETSRIFRMGGLNPPFFRLWEREDAWLNKRTAVAWGALEQQGRGAGESAAS